MIMRLVALALVAVSIAQLAGVKGSAAQLSSSDARGTAINNVFQTATPRALASGQRTLQLEPQGPYQGNVIVKITKDRAKIDGWGGMCIQAAKAVDLTRYRFVTLVVEPSDVVEKLEYKLEQGPFGPSAQQLRLAVAAKQGKRVQLPIPPDPVARGAERFCVALTFDNMVGIETKTLTLTDIQFWTRDPSTQ